MRRAALYSLWIILCLALPATAMQDTLPPASWSPGSPQAHAESFLGDLVAGDTKTAFKTFFSLGRYPKNTTEKLQFDYFQRVKQQGNPVGYEKVFEQRAGRTVTRLKYVLLFKNDPMMFDLYYYTLGKGLILKSFTISHDIKKIFER